MKQKNLFELIQNPAIGAYALHSFVLGYYDIARNRKEKIPYPNIHYLFFILPIVYRKSSMETFLSSRHLYTALKDNKTITLELQEKANKMSKQTFDSLNLAFSKKILTYDKTNKVILLLPGFQSNKLPFIKSINNSENDIKKIQNSAFRLGSIFAKEHTKNIQIDLNIRF